jgi:phosphatidate cytidylyltransferase
MKTRIISSLAALVVLAIILAGFYTPILNVAISIICLLSIYEIFMATKYVNIKTLSAVSYIFVAIFPFLPSIKTSPLIMFVLLGFSFMLFMVLLRNHENETFEQIGLVFMLSTLLPFSLSSIIYLRENFQQDALFYVFLILICAFGADTGAYFAGKFFGKHKLAPIISPKKTIEGAIGGVLCVIILSVLAGLVYTQIMKNQQVIIKLDYFVIIIISLIGSTLGILGDLTASIIKRKCSLKDFGDIMPGHGGVLDRIDSLLFVSPFIYCVLHFVKIVQ